MPSSRETGVSAVVRGKRTTNGAKNRKKCQICRGDDRAYDFSDRGVTQIAGTYVGEQGTVAAGNQAGGNWIYGGPNAEIGMVSSGVVKDAGYNLATGVAAMTIRLKQ